MLTNPIITKINQQQMLDNRPEFKVGDTIAVVVRVIEGDKERLQTFQGVVIAINNRGLHSSFIVRKISHGVGVERTFLIHSRMIQDIRLVRTGAVRQAKIYYMRERSGKSARIAERFDNKSVASKSTGAKKAKSDTATTDSAKVEAMETAATKQAEATTELPAETPAATNQQVEATATTASDDKAKVNNLEAGKTKPASDEETDSSKS